MKRPSQIRQIVAELRRALGPEPAAWELLRLAAIIVEAHREPEFFELEGDFDPIPFFALDVDTAVEDGGWKVLDFERRGGLFKADDISDDQNRIQYRLRRIGRTAWPRTETD